MADNMQRDYGRKMVGCIGDIVIYGLTILVVP